MVPWPDRERQFSLRTLLLVVTVLSCALGLAARYINSLRAARVQQEILHQLWHLGGDGEFLGEKFVVVAHVNEPQVKDHDLGFLRRATGLRSLNLSKTSITDAGLKHLSGLTNLEELRLRNTKITSEGLKHLANLKRLKKLDLGGTSITDAGLRQLSGLTDLEIVWLDGTDVSNSGLAHIGHVERVGAPLSVWHERVRSGDGEDQRRALKYLADLRPVDRRSVAELSNLLGDGPQASAAAVALGQIGFDAYESSIQLARITAESRDAGLRQAALVALLRIDPFRVVELPTEVDLPLIVALSDKNPWVRRYAAYCLGARQAKSAGVEDALHATTQSDDAKSAEAARLALCQIRGDLRYGSPILSPDTQSKSAYEDMDVLACVVALDGDDEAAIARALYSLKKLGPQGAPAVPGLVRRLEANGQRVERPLINAIKAIGQDARPTASHLKRLQERKPDLDVAVALYCVEPTPENLSIAWEMIRPLIHRAYSLDGDDSLSEFLELQPIPAELFIELLGTSKNDIVRREIADHLIKHQSTLKSHVPQIAALLSREPEKQRALDRDPVETARLAADVLAAIGPDAEQAAEPLLEQLNSSSWTIQRSVVRALGRIATARTAEKILAALRPMIVPDSDEVSQAAEFAVRRIGVMLGASGTTLSADDMAFVSSVRPYSLRSEFSAIKYWRPPADPVADPPRVPAPQGTLADLLLAVEQWRKTSGYGDVEQLVRAAGEGGPAVRPAAPLLLSMLNEDGDHERTRLAIVYALWRLTRSPLVAAIMVDHGIVSPETIREMGPTAECLVPFLLGSQNAVDVPGSFLTRTALPGWLCLPVVGPRARDALPQLRAWMKSRDGRLAGSGSALNIWRIDHDESVIPWLISQLSPGSPFARKWGSGSEREFVAWALGRIGPPAKEAVPLLAEAAYIDNGEFGVAAAWAVGQIDPDAAKAWGLDEPQWLAK